MRLCDRKLEIG